MAAISMKDRQLWLIRLGGGGIILERGHSSSGAGAEC